MHKMIDTPHNIAVRKHRAKKLAWAIQFLGGVCERCGSVDNLEFNHIDPLDKSFTIGSNLGRNKKVLIAELLKCELLCHNCHMLDTLFRQGAKPAAHGTPGKYTNGKCRCRPCKDAWAQYKRTKRWH